MHPVSDAVKVLVGLSLGILGTIAFQNFFGTNATSFFAMNLFQILSLSSTILIGFFVSFYLNGLMSKKIKRTDFLLNVVIELRDKLPIYRNEVSAIQEDFNEDTKKKLLLLLKDLGNRSSTIASIAKPNTQSKKIAVDTGNEIGRLKDFLTDECYALTSFNETQRSHTMKFFTNLEGKVSQLIVAMLN